MFSHVRWKVRSDQLQGSFSQTPCVDLVNKEETGEVQSGQKKRHKKDIPVVWSSIWASHRSFSLFISFIMSHIWVCTCKDIILHVSYLSGQSRVKTAKRSYSACALSAVFHISRQTCVVSAGAPWDDLTQGNINLSLRHTSQAQNQSSDRDSTFPLLKFACLEKGGGVTTSLNWFHVKLKPRVYQQRIQALCRRRFIVVT